MSRAPIGQTMRLLRLAALVIGGLVALLVIEAALARRGPEVPFTPPSPAPVELGSGPPLEYVVLGDSTAAGQGASYDRGIALETARHLAASHRVTLTNLAVSGARMGDVETRQAPVAVGRHPDVVLVAAGANDVTGLTSVGSVIRSLDAVVRDLRTANPRVVVVVTGAADMGSIPRLAQPLRAVAGWRTRQLNVAIEELVRRRGLVLAPIARATGPAFRRDPSLFAADRFHPDGRGYATWIPVLTKALDEGLRARPAGGRAVTPRRGAS